MPFVQLSRASKDIRRRFSGAHALTFFSFSSPHVFSVSLRFSPPYTPNCFHYRANNNTIAYTWHISLETLLPQHKTCHHNLDRAQYSKHKQTKRTCTRALRGIFVASSSIPVVEREPLGPSAVSSTLPTTITILVCRVSGISYQLSQLLPSTRPLQNLQHRRKSPTLT